MSNLSPRCLPDPVMADSVFTLSQDISAIQILSFSEKDTRLGPVSKLPRGAQLEVCGRGFDDQTVKASSQGQFYFIFLADLAKQKHLAATAS